MGNVGKGGGGGKHRLTYKMRFRTVELSSAQILALNVTEVEIVPAPGVGLVIVPISASVTLRFNTIAYAGAITINLYNGPNGNLIRMFSINLATITAAAATTSIGQDTPAFEQHGPKANLENQNIRAFVPGAGFTLGNSPLLVTVFYDVAPV